MGAGRSRGTSTEYWWGDEWQHSMANSRHNGARATTEVGVFPPNPYGLFDVLGNVWEWCEDIWVSRDCDASLSGSATDSTATEHRVVRGGSWLSDLGCLSVSFRRASYIGFRYDLLIGVRLARDVR